MPDANRIWFTSGIDRSKSPNLNIQTFSNRDKTMKEIVPQAEAADFAYDYVVKELEKLECRL